MASTIFKKNGTLLTVRPEGRLDLVSAPPLETEIQQYLDGVRKVIMDFEDVEYITSAGLRLLVSVDRVMSERGGDIKVIHANRNVIDVFSLVNLTDMLDVECG